MFIILRKIERWLHQHVFKVGWLLTQNSHTTTILYYIFFLPGIVLREVTLWLSAGILNVQAEHVLQWPSAQETSEIRLNLVRISRRASELRRAIIVTVPTLAGMIVLGHIAQERFGISAVLQTISSGALDDVGRGIGLLTSTPDFWLWFYLAFTIGNTMFPSNFRDLRGWRVILLPAVGIFIVLVLLGAGSGIFTALQPAIRTLIDALSGIFVLLIGINLIAVLILGTIESGIERITGNSATYRRGRLVAMTRAERLELEQRERERNRRRAIVQAQQSGQKAPISTVYQIILPVPGPPGIEPVSQPNVAILSEQSSLPQGRSQRKSATLIRGEAKPATRELPLLEAAEEPAAPKISFPQPLRSAKTSSETEKTSEQHEEKSAQTASSPFALSAKPESERSEAPVDQDHQTDSEQDAKHPAPDTFKDTADDTVEAEDVVQADDVRNAPADRQMSGSPFLRPSFGKPVEETSAADDYSEETSAEEDDSLPSSRSLPFRPTVSPFARAAQLAKEDAQEEEPEVPEQSRERPETRAALFAPGHKPQLSPFGRSGTEKSGASGSEEASKSQTKIPGIGEEQRRPSPFAKPANPFTRPQPPASTGLSDDEEEEEEEKRRPTLRGVFTPASPTSRTKSPISSAFVPDDEEETEEEETAPLRNRSTGDAISSLFADMKLESADDLRYEDDDEYSDYADDDDSPSYSDD